MRKTLLFLLAIFVTSSSLFTMAQAIELSLNQTRFLSGDNLVLTLDEDWTDEADIYVAVSLPGIETWYFLTPSGFALDVLPYAQAQKAGDSREIFRIEALTEGLPVGEYGFIAGITQPNTLDIIGEIVQTPFLYLATGDDGNISFPDGLIEHFYSFALAPQSGPQTERFSLTEGTLPAGLTLGEETGLIQGTPTEGGAAQFTIQATDNKDNVSEIEGLIRVWNVLTFGEHGTFKGCNGLQMALNMAKDLDEVRIEQGRYSCNGLETPTKKWEYGIKISGGWDSSFKNQSYDPTLTVLEGKGKKIVDIEPKTCLLTDGVSWDDYELMVGISPSELSCVEDGKSILTISTNSGIVTVENLSFNNGYASSGGGAITGNLNNSDLMNMMLNLNVNNCIFANNESGTFGGAIVSGNITNSIFTNNKSLTGGGAVSVSKKIVNSIFKNNATLAPTSAGGAVDAVTSIINSIFINNSSGGDGGAVYGSYATNITNSTFTNNSATNSGGAFRGRGTILNSIFAQNQAAGEDNDITPGSRKLHVDYTIANYISGGVDIGTHFIMGEPRFVDAANGDFRLLPDSPAINVGDSSVVDEYPFLKDGSGNPLDLDGNPRIVGDAIDLGAFEVQ